MSLVDLWDAHKPTSIRDPHFPPILPEVAELIQMYFLRVAL